HYYVHGPGGSLLAEYVQASGEPELVRDYVYLGSNLITSIGVGSTPPPPAVSVVMSSPHVGDGFPDGEDITLTADPHVAAPDNVSSVEFYANGALLGTATSAPYTITWPAVLAGSYTLLARVTTSGGHATTSAGVPIIVFPAGRVTSISVSASPFEGQAATL